MTLSNNHRGLRRHQQALCVLVASALSMGLALRSSTVLAQPPLPHSTPTDSTSVPVFLEVDTSPLTESEQPADAADADAETLHTQLPVLLERRGIQLADEATQGVGHLKVSLGWKYYRESVYQVSVVYTSPDGVERTSDWTLEGIDSGDVVDEFDARLDKYQTWFMASPPPPPPLKEPPLKEPGKTWLAVSIGGASLAVTGGAIAVAGAVLGPEEQLGQPTTNENRFGRPGTKDNSTRRALVYSGAAIAGIGATLAAVGFSLHFSRRSKDQPTQRASLAPLLGRGLTGLSATGRF